jgi:hypothetical protein
VLIFFDDGDGTGTDWLTGDLVIDVYNHMGHIELSFSMAFRTRFYEDYGTF